MNEHAGSACALSGLIVALFAILLHDKSPPSPLSKSPALDASAPAIPGVKTTSDATTSILPPKSSEAIKATPLNPVGKNPVSISSNLPDGKRVAVPEPIRIVKAEPPPGPTKVAVKVVAPVKSVVASPRSPFTIVRLGESLADVATRVYGSLTETEALWKANRDQVERIDSPVDSGTILRTP